MKKAKKFLSVILTCLMLFSTTFAVTASAAKLGDVDGNSSVNSSDALLVIKHSVGSAKLDSSKQKKADVNGDGKINSSDALIILKISVGSYEGDTGEKEDAYTALVNYVLANGYHKAGSDYYIVYYEEYSDGEKLLTSVSYDIKDKELAFLYQTGSSATGVASNTYLAYEPGASKQIVLYEAEFKSAPSITGMGCIYTKSFSPDGGTITEFDCSDNDFYSEMLELTEIGTVLLFYGMTDLLRATGLGITLADLGFTSWPY